jgi:hypothetical protein
MSHHAGFAFFRLGDSQSDILATIGVLFFVSTQTRIHGTQLQSTTR